MPYKTQLTYQLTIIIILKMSETYVKCDDYLAPPPPAPVTPCQPSLCGTNARCRTEGLNAICECLPDYRGNPYDACRPECLTSADCPAAATACISQHCVDPCPGTCGVNARCDVINHVPICSCTTGYTGDAFRVCNPIVQREEPPIADPCNPSPCGINTRCEARGSNAICTCLPGFFGAPSVGGCRPECTISADCPLNRACSNMKCIDPCPGTCGFATNCQVVNHSPVCSCPPPLIGDPFTLCHAAPQPPPPSDPCQPSPCRSHGQCIIRNGIASCLYPECVINQDCSRDRACYGQKCGDPCRGACGQNALCQAINHRAVCLCPEGYIGSGEVQCRLKPADVPKPECVQDSECPTDKSCINQQCRNPCSENPNICAHNANCRVQLHRPVCNCRDGFTGNPNQACYEIGCRSDSECPATQSCLNRNCIDPCTYTQCGINALCRPDGNHRARCYCPERFRGDPQVRCDRPQCINDDECPEHLTCRNERCEDPCNCGLGAECTVRRHRADCRCPVGWRGNPTVTCERAPVVIEYECKTDADCASKLACFNGNCKNPCLETKPCGRNAECFVVDTLPLRTMSCQCLPGYVGDADTECKQVLQEEPGCKTNDDCPLSEFCTNRRCLNPCSVNNPCARTAECHATSHKAVCRCPAGLIGDPFIRCSQPVQDKPECTSDLECSNDRACINERCQDPCVLANPCGANARCRTNQHRPTCQCPDGWGGNPQVQCYKPECKVDTDCPYHLACLQESCLNPCATTSCGRGAKCEVQYHRAQCQCPVGTQGNPLISCIAGVCQYNEDCADHEACDRLNRVCRDVCEVEDSCADTATCIGQAHQPKCSCPPGLMGNPYVECLAGRQPVEAQPECRTDGECPSKYACINQRCQNPCSINNICTVDQECRVLDTLPLRTVMCQCPSDTFVDSNGRCRPIQHEQVECHVDSECADKDKCIRGSCIEACRVDQCGINAQCNSRYHQAICACSPGYTGNAHVECTNVPKIPIPIPIPECYSDADCTYDKTCRNEFCVNPCTDGRPCALGAFCSAKDHRALCNCPAGYEGNPKIDCIAPLGPAVGCKSNSDCARSEHCFNTRCVNPCNCGANAECRVTNHYPICYCRPGYSGNPQTGCVKLECTTDKDCLIDQQCYNSQCINPCILGDPCASTAECYGSNHRTACRCPTGYSGNAYDRCERVECHVDSDCPSTRACLNERCVDPCSTIANPPCAQNAICYAQNHAAGCLCPDHLPEGNPVSYCQARVIVEGKPECVLDPDCPSKMACIKNTCVNPCEKLVPCHRSAHCSVLDTIPVRTMICTCPEGWVPNINGECQAVIIPIPPGCSSDADCPSKEACINRMCRNPCQCGTNSACFVQNHRPICSCQEGHEGNPNIACRTVGCRTDSECDSGKACVNGNCISPCLVRNTCGINAECYVYRNRAECRCLSGYRGNAMDRCLVIGCTSNSDCPNDRQCINAQCINPCVYDNPCAARAECKVQNHLSLCRCPAGFLGNPYVDCRREPQPECREDSECPARLACLSNKCQDPCRVLEPCHNPAECQVVPSLPVRTMICVCPPGYISSGSGTCVPTLPVKEIGGCVTDKDCPELKSCVQGICKDPCNCGLNSECRIKNHKPVCTCKQGYDGNPEIECVRIGCKSDDQCSGQHTCVNRQCVPVCAADKSTCGRDAECIGINHRAICQCPAGFMGNPKVSCVLIGCRADSECPTNRACINSKCETPCSPNPCHAPSECRVHNHKAVCACPPSFYGDGKGQCIKEEEKCKSDVDCPSQTACINAECVNPCLATTPCGVNAECRVLDTEPVRTMICVCLPGYQGNAAVQCDKIALCRIDKGFIRTPDGSCVCPPNTGLNENEECILCPIEKGLKIDDRGRCVCALERGLIIDERGNCVCPTEFGYRLDIRGNCVPSTGPECENDNDCADHKFCNPSTKTCDDPCLTKHCGVNAFCNATNHRAVCQCITKYTGDPEVVCSPTSPFRTDFPRPEMLVSCLSDGVQVEIHITEQGFNGVLYVKGHSKDEQCRRVVTLPSDSIPRTEIFKVHFGNCGLIHVNGQASFVLVIQKHPKLVTYKAQAYHIKCVYQTGEQNVTLGFNVSMLTTAGTIANTGPPPTCIMKIITPTGQEINSAEIGDNLMLQVDVQPGSIYGGFARSCVAKTMEDNIENEYLVTDENGCATDPTIFGEWEYNGDTQSLLASFNAFKFPSSDNIRFQCNIRVCFGKCQPVNCRGYNAFGRRKRAIDNNSDTTDVMLPGGDLLSGQLREEITIQSNAILTFERREERFADPQEAADAQRVEDICVSMIGFIIALIITALLALVAVAVAVSCWLMAYRRRPKPAGPLPHPPEFPNPLFTTPEPMAEPSPDYLT